MHTFIIYSQTGSLSVSLADLELCYVDQVDLSLVVVISCLHCSGLQV